jgi:acyl-CoA reductase-like NAD-dependent aldehyde dehydrogenase
MTRLNILKTYKLYIGGKFPRTESGRYYQPLNNKREPIANMCLASRKDFRNAVVAARKAQQGWASKTAYNRSQILYRIAEMLEGARGQFESELIQQGSTKKAANVEIDLAIDRLVYYAGWCDKYTQIFGAVNPVASSHFNFSTHEPMGVVSCIASDESSLLGSVSLIAPVIASGNTVILVASESKPLCSISLAEVINNSDVPDGVVNVLTGHYPELLKHMGSHMDVNAIWFVSKANKEEIIELQTLSADNVKRVSLINQNTGANNVNAWESPYLLKAFTEVKTTWHPVEVVGGASSVY